MAENASNLVIEAAELKKIFRDFWRRPKVRAVDGVSFEVRRGEVFGLLGPNGSGKSTTIKMILGLLHPSGGRLRVLDQSPRHVKTKARVGYLPEHSYLYPYLTSEETLDFYGKLFDLNGRERDKRIEQLLEMIGLQHARHRMVGEFSKGMARRIGLAQALINDPDLVVLDEPTSGLDPIGCRQVKDLIVTLAKRGKTVLMSSHLLADVEDVCDRIAILYNGKIHAMGPIRELLQEKGRSRIALPELSPESVARVLALLRKEFGSEPELDHPQLDLEKFFLDVVEKARRGAQAEAPKKASVASYLTGEDRLQQLATAPAPAKNAEPEVAAPPPKPAPETDAKLSRLVKK
ncbi:MAG: ABC transporter ATP-binding protein [Kiritimatiellia bacterium]